MKHLCLVLLFALALPMAAQERAITRAEINAGAFSVTIAQSASLSTSVSIGQHCTPVGIQMPAEWTAANLTFRAAVSSETPAALYDIYGTEVTATAAASRYIVLEPASFIGVRVFQIRSGTAASPVTQAAARTLTVVCR